MSDSEDQLPDRREFMARAAAVGTALSAAQLLGSAALGVQTTRSETNEPADEEGSQAIAKSIIGHYGVCAAGLADDPPLLSYPRLPSADVDKWRQSAVGFTRANTSSM